VASAGRSCTESVATAKAEQVARGVDQDRQWRTDQLHQKAGQSRPGGLCNRVGAIDTRVGTLEVLAWHEAGQERHRCRVVDEGSGPIARDDHEQQGQ
jgi:hypothetical protein